jgi:hypothetical protein
MTSVITSGEIVFVNDTLTEDYLYDEPEPSHQTAIKYVQSVSEADFNILVHVPAALFAQDSVNPQPKSTAKICVMSCYARKSTTANEALEGER